MNDTSTQLNRDDIETLMADMPDAVVVLDPQAKILFANAPADRLFAVEPDALVGRPSARPVIDTDGFQPDMQQTRLHHGSRMCVSHRPTGRAPRHTSRLFATLQSAN